MEEKFEDILSDASNLIFHVVFFPDRVYHAQYLNATRSVRYRYKVEEVRAKADITVVRGRVYMDGAALTNFLRIEYRASRLVETARQQNRLLGSDVIGGVELYGADGAKAQAYARMHLCPWIDAYQVEFWDTLQPPPGRRHDHQVLDLMGFGGSIVREPAFDRHLRDLKSVREMRLWFRETDLVQPSGYFLPGERATWDNYYERNTQVPNTQEPSSAANTVKEANYRVDFQRGWFIPNARSVKPVRYRNAMMNDGAAEAGPDNVIEMRWVLQQEFGGSIVFFHEVTIPPHTVEGAHQHIGSEELYYVTEGKGFAYIGANDNPDGEMNAYDLVQRDIYGLGPRPCRKVPVAPGSVIFTKSGGIHGIENPNDAPLRFVAFLHHTS